MVNLHRFRHCVGLAVPFALLPGGLAFICFMALAGVGGTQERDSTEPDTFSDEELRFFESEVRPLLIASCLECHSEQRQEGNLRLDSRPMIFAGGDSGPAVSINDLPGSLLVRAVHHVDLEMPPSGKLPEREIQVLERWVAQGLPWPSNTVLIRDSGSRLPTAEDRNHWAYRPLSSPPLPMLADSDWALDDLDLFVLEAQQDLGITPAPEADRLTLARRVSFDLIGLPPPPELLDEFLLDQESGAYERFVDRLLQSPQFGERWADAWFDWVRFAESDGYKADDFRPTAWRYRDYVISSLNTDLPFDQFLLEQIAGDLIESPTAESLTATGYLRLWIYEYNQRDARTQWQTILDDVTETTADALLGMGIGCAKCHDHKYDPLVQEDYFRLQAVFTSFSAVDRVPLLDSLERSEYEAQLQQWREKYQRLLDEKTAIERPHFERAMQAAVEKFPPDIQGMFKLSVDERTTFEQQLVELSMRQIEVEVSKIDYEKKLASDELVRWQSLREQLSAAEAELPLKPETVLGVAEIADADWSWPVLSDQERLVAPGLPLVLVEEGASPEFSMSRPRRLEFAQWLISSDNPLTARVLANRVWERLLGNGLVDSSSDFGLLTPPPRLAELLDFVASRWRDEGWSFKSLVREIVTSATYRQASIRPDEAMCLAADPENRTWWKTARRRLDAGQIRDALLVASDELQVREGGPSANHDSLCRSVYLKVLRNSQDSVLGVFDFPDRIRSTSCRNLTTTPQQALLLLNHPWVRARASRLSTLVRPDNGRWDEATAIRQLFVRTIGREPSSEERELLGRFIHDQNERGASEGLEPQAAYEAAWFDACHGLLNSNEFLFLE